MQRECYEYEQEGPCDNDTGCVWDREHNSCIGLECGYLKTQNDCDAEKHCSWHESGCQVDCQTFSEKNRCLEFDECDYNGECVQDDNGISTFDKKEGKVCKEDGKPLVLLFSSSSCSHCRWIGPVFDSVANEYGDNIEAYHWELDENDNLLTEEKESEVPDEHLDIFGESNPKGNVPKLVFGCKYVRVGTAYEHEENGKEKAEEEFRAVIEKLQ